MFPSSCLRSSCTHCVIDKSNVYYIPLVGAFWFNFFPPALLSNRFSLCFRLMRVVSCQCYNDRNDTRCHCLMLTIDGKSNRWRKGMMHGVRYDDKSNHLSDVLPDYWLLTSNGEEKFILFSFTFDMRYNSFKQKGKHMSWIKEIYYWHVVAWRYTYDPHIHRGNLQDYFTRALPQH